MKINNIMALTALTMGMTQVIAGTEVDALKDRVTTLENTKPKVEIGGAIEMVYGKNENDTAEPNTKKFFVDSVELMITGNINEDFNAVVTILSEQDGATGNSDLANPVIDAVELNGKLAGIDFTIGKFGADFGNDDLGDTSVRAVKISTEIKGTTLSMFSGNHGNNGFTAEYATNAFTIGAKTIKDAALGEADNSDDNNGDTLNGDSFDNKGTMLYAEVPFGDITASFEQIKVKGSAGSAQNAKWANFGLEYGFNDDLSVSIGKTRSQEAGVITDTTKSTTLGVAYTLAEGVNFEIEREKETGGDAEVTAKLIYEF
ncbi:MAG: hypothetical protein Ctma_0426 [Catillopecten margaritatus gill symbiont]|uniref:Porin domain-containing protein n=1 Tax=Catillopecten margaritatus gill symbiont TaxID=3083288 RepID=A0AAU6PFE1_9GAMM